MIEKRAGGGVAVSRKYLDEFLMETATPKNHKIIKEPRQFGNLAGKFIIETVTEQFPKHKKSLSDSDLNDAHACANAFFIKRYHSLVILMDNFEDLENSDEEFERYVRKSVGKWFLTKDMPQNFGKVRDIVRKRMERDALGRFKKTMQGWTRANGPKDASTIN